MTNDGNQTELEQGIIKRLDALIRLYIETSKPEKKNKFGEGEAIRLLKSVDLTPTEIAKILGKKSATDVSYALYPKKEKSEEEKKQEEVSDVRTAAN
jgi:hypothetical protein